MTGTDYYGNKFITKSQFQFTNVADAVRAGAELGPAAQCALKAGVEQQLAFENR